MKQGVELGRDVTDIVTGLNGLVTAKTQYLTGPDRVLIEGRDVSGRPFGVWVDVQRIRVDEDQGLANQIVARVRGKAEEWLRGLCAEAEARSSPSGQPNIPAEPEGRQNG